MKLTILGAGTLSAFIIDIVGRIPKFEVVGQYDDRFPEFKSSNGFPILGRLDDAMGSIPLALGIGEPDLRKTLFERMASRGCEFPPIIDLSCVISETAIIEEGAIIGPLSTVLTGSVVAKGACLLSHVNVNQNVHVGPFALIAAGVVIGNGAHIGDRAHLGLGTVVFPGEQIEAGRYVKGK